MKLIVNMKLFKYINLMSTNPKINGEYDLFNFLKDEIEIMFDVGTRTDIWYIKNNKITYCFEPSDNYKILLEKVKKMNLENKCVLNNFGLGKENKEVIFYPDTQSIVKRTHDITSKPSNIKINIKRLDDYCLKNNIKNIDFIKIDTEGYELDVLLGGKNIILNSTKYVQFEYGGTYLDSNITLKDISNFFGDKWYFYHIQRGGLCYINDISKINHYKYCNFLASKIKF